MRRIWLALAAAFMACAAAPDTSGIFYDQHPGAQLPVKAPFTDQDGRAVALADAIASRPAVIAIGYYDCPALCGVTRDDTLAALAHSGLRTPGDYRLIFVSIDPAETPAQAAGARARDMARYPQPGAAEGWEYLTGPAASVQALEDAAGFHARYDTGLKQFLHPAGIIVATPAGRISRYLLGVGYQPGDVRAALVAASDGGIERAAQPVLLLCFHFDPVTGRYTLAVMKLLRLGGALTVVTIGGLLLVLRWRERRVRASGNRIR